MGGEQVRPQQLATQEGAVHSGSPSLNVRQPVASRPTTVLGIMSGTSIDSVDFALCRVSANAVSLRRHWQANFPEALQRRLHAAARGDASTWELGRLHHDLGRFYAAAALRGLGKERPALVGLHGQTVFHGPEPTPPVSRRGEADSLTAAVRRLNAPTGPATLQIGEAAWLVEALRVPVVNNFRAADLAAGGQGAPLATLFHRVVFGRKGQFVCVNNLGGISNVTALDWRHGAQPGVLAFDTGPANSLLDLATRHFTRGRQAFDRDGAGAARGAECERLLDRWLGHKFFAQPPPKSTGRELFGEPFWEQALPETRAARLNSCDVLATLTEFTARSIALNYRRHLGPGPDRVILSGGGASNPTLVRRIAANLAEFAPAVEVLTSEALGWPVQAIEPAAFALLAYYRRHELPGNLPETTGARRPAVLGQIAVP